MRLQVLALCRDPEVVRILRRILPDLGIDPVLSSNADEARAVLARRKFDGFIADCDGIAGATEVLQSVRQEPWNRSCIVFALISRAAGVRRAFELGANFVLERPLSLGRALRSFRAGHGLMAREAHRYYRHSINLPVALDFGGGVVQHYTATNISEGGMAVRASRKLPLGASVLARFRLPGGSTVIEARGEITWTEPDGRAGLRLTPTSARCREELTAWLVHAYERDNADTVLLNTAAALDEPGPSTRIQ